jgi:hypothetical protein
MTLCFKSPMAVRSIFIFCILFLQLSSQKLTGFGWPLDPPFTISGNYGELRSNHFHAGIDFSTRNQVNLPVYAVADGYVSRIKVSPYGYGRCIYITHPGGKVSVYAHLSSFSIKLADIVVKEQYLQKNFEVEMFPKPNAIQVKKGEIIGLSGNSGSSTGPHLHFEIREERSETPLNVLRLLDVPDKVRPVIQSLALYSLADTTSPVFLSTHRVTSVNDSTFGLNRVLLLNEGVIGVAFSGFDRMNTSGNANNIFAAQLYLDNKLIYAHELTGVDFSESRFVNEFSEQVERTKYQKCFLPALYPAGIYTSHVRKGRIFLRDTSVHTLKLVLADEAGNKSFFACTFRTSRLTTFLPPSLNSGIFARCDRDFVFSGDRLRLFIAKGTLYNSTPLIIANNIETSSKIVIFPETNLRNAISIGFAIPASLAQKETKLVLRNGAQVTAGYVRNDSVYFDVKNLGTFHLYVDDHAPSIVLQKPHRKRKTAVRSVSFRILDKLSGISKYSIHVNDVWVLAEYDAKYDLLTYTFDESTPTGRLKVRVNAEDKVGNRAVMEYFVQR